MTRAEPTRNANQNERQKWKARWWWFVIRYRGTNKWRIFEAIGLGSVVIYTGVTFQQWHLARQQLVGTLGAVLEATSGGNNAICGLNGAGKEGELVCTFSNIGHVTATVKHLELSVSDGVLSLKAVLRLAGLLSVLAKTTLKSHPKNPSLLSGT